jgi:hypothetical protein
VLVRGAPLDGLNLVGRVLDVSIHAPARGATQAPLRITSATLSFPSTRPYGARRLRGAFLRRVKAVSTHAPALGATRRPRGLLFRHPCFNPRARTGRDIRRASRKRKSTSFNPRARTGRDLAVDPQHLGLGVVSIHAPVWRDDHTLQPWTSPRCFNPRALTERDVEISG